MGLGLLAALGTTRLSGIVLAITIIWLFYLIAFHPQRVRAISFPPVLLLIIICVAISAFWSKEPGKPLWMCSHILAGWLLWQTLPKKRAIWGISAVVAVQIGVILWQYIALPDVHRPAAFARNASMLGLSGMWLMPNLPSALMAGLSGSRTAILGVWLFASINRSRSFLLAANIATAAFVAVTLWQFPSRISLPGIEKSIELRENAITGTSYEVIDHPLIPIIPKEKTAPEWRWYGYGFGQYSYHTGQIQPHNIFVRAWYEMGLFTIPIGYCLVYLWTERIRGKRFRDHDWSLLIVACATGMLTDELIGSVEGVYMLLGFAIMRSTGAARD